MRMQLKLESGRECTFARALLGAAFACLAAAGCSKTSSQAATVAPGSPASPSNLSATAGFTAVHLKWTDNSDDETHFRIDRQRDNGDWKMQGTVAANVTEFGSIGLETNTRYGYRVRAGNANGLSSPAKVTIQTPIAPTSACGLVVGEALSEPKELNENVDRYWVWAVHSGAEVVVARAPAAGAEEVELNGGLDGTTWVVSRRRERGNRIELEMRMRFSELQPQYDGFEGPLCIMLHDLSSGGYVESGLQSSSREPFLARLPMRGPVPIVPGESYFVTLHIDRTAALFDVFLNGIQIGMGLPLEGVLVIPSVYVHP